MHFISTITMRFLHSFLSPLLLSSAFVVSAASSWGFEDATLTIQSKGAGAGGGLKERYAEPVPSTVLRSKANSCR